MNTTIKHIPNCTGLRVAQVVFEDHSEGAPVWPRREVAVDAENAFDYADACKCGGVVSAVILSDGFRCFASGRWFNPRWPANHGAFGLSAVHVGAYGSAWLTREWVRS